MIKVIKHGKYFKDTKCRNCECVFEFDPVDIHDSAVPTIHGNMYYRFVRCPECNKEVIIPND